MAEAIAISLSAKLAVALSRRAFLSLSSLFGVRSDMAAAKQDLELLRDFLHFADSNHAMGAPGVSWVRQFRDASFELEDVADECCYLSGNGSARNWVNVRAWFALSRRLRKARERLVQLSAARELYGIRHADGAARPDPVIATSQMLAESAHFERKEIVGFAAHEKHLLEWVVEDADTRRMQVGVWGMGGVGKTTLVTRVYKEVATTSHFDCAAWVAVSQDFTMDDLLRKILKELHAKINEDTGYRSLIAAIRHHLRERRYLVVLDDIWDAHLWDKLRHAFPDDTNRSRVVITTRSRDVAKAAAPERIMILEPLPWHEAWALFCNNAFRGASSRTCPSHLVELATDVVKRCRGLPLAIISIGNLLALKESTELAWKNVHDSLVWDGSSNYLGIGEAASILNLSIDDLPPYLKKCFLSCSIYAEDFLIKRKILIRKWVAQGFIQDNPGQHRAAEDVADDYLDQLVQRSLMQVIESNEFGRAKRCLIHDLIRDLIIHRSREEEGFFQFTNCEISLDRNVKIRHLAVDRCELGCQTVPNQASLRSFHAFGSEFDALFLSRFRLLTVLNLWFVETDKLPDSVTSLHNLRYLGIRSTLIEDLPKDLGKLQKLQTLDAKLSMVQRLPRSTAKLKCLRHLILFRRRAADFWRPFPCTAVKAPEGLQNLTSLQSLKYVRADKKMVRSLARLEQMRSLELSGVDASHIPDLSSSICRLSCLVRLGLEMEPGEDAVLDLESIRQPPLKLRKLALTGMLAGGKLPSWIRSLNSLVQLRLCRCDIGQDSLVLLGALPGLVNLSLVAAYRDGAITFVRGSFPTLRRLKLQGLPNLRHIQFQQGCLVMLHDLVLGQCAELAETPYGMENLTHIHNLEIFDMPTEFSDRLREQNGYYKPANLKSVPGPGKNLRYLRWTGRNK